jgi:hypothetical protein
MAILSFLSFHCKKNTESYANHTGGSYNQSINPGNSSRDFLASTKYKSLKIEIQYMPGLKPDSESIKIFVDLLNEKLNKPAGISVEEKQINPTLLTIFNLSDISGIEFRNRTAYTSGDQMGAYILFIDGTYYTGNILGLTYTNTSICYFGEPLKYFLSGGTQEDKINKLALLLLHEFGHLLGLVNMGSPMVVDHLDNNNGSHCNNNKCLMHHTLEEIKPNIEQILLENPSFDKNCSDDLKANEGK